MSSKLKLGLLAIVAAALFALPGVFSSGIREVSAAPVLSNGQGDVCFRAVNMGNQASGNPQIPVGVEFDAFARTQDSFHLPLTVFAIGFGNTGSVPTNTFTGPNPSLAGNYLVIPQLNLPFDFPYVIPFHMAVSIDGQVGEAKIHDRIEDHSLARISGRFPFVERNGVAWTWPSILNVIDMFGVATENVISPVNTILGLDILTELAGGGGDMDSVNSDIQEFFVNPAAIYGTELDETVAKGALDNCGLPFLSGNSAISSSNMSAIWHDMVYCFTIGDPGACNDLAIRLDIDCSTGSGGCISPSRLITVNLDGWSQISVHCTKPGEVKITWDPTNWYGSDFGFSFSPTRNEGMSQDIECIGPANSATASSTGSPATVEIHPVGTSRSQSTIVVTVFDANGKRLDGAVVTFTTDNCRLGTSSSGPFDSNQSATTTSDTDTSSDLSYIAANSAPGNQLFAGTAEAYLECNNSSGKPGTATVTWIVNQQLSGTGVVQTNAPLTGTVTVTVIGSPSAIKLDVSPATSTCGNPVTATATVTDAAGKPVSDGTEVFFTTVTATGTQGGVEGAQGHATTVNGVATVTLSVDPTDPGTHTVSARTGGTDLKGDAVVVVSISTTFNCSAVAAAPPVTAPNTGQGPSIVPPNTGDAGLAASSSTSYGLFALAGVVALALAGVVKFGFARNS